uniref:Homocysteine-responsive ER-resident ubiquitin-like domain member 1 n=1 Tax=Oncorhynchus mykiss TaxID=8022 RepID=Q0H911_ONCMY|nr:homocysteine-responsive ER-resident ubiquitin-like domain member 1 [Oncorhynchus mykiss]
MDNSGFPNVRQKTITLVIKTPNQAHGDQTIEGVDTDWTVKELKTHLSRVYPNNPTESDQRLIYSGKLLPDQLHVRDIFRKTDLTPTVHLVCAVRTQPRGPLGARPKVREPEPQPSAMPTRQNPEAYAAAASAPFAPATGPSLPAAPHQAAVPAPLPNQAPIDNLPANQNAQDGAFINPGAANQNLRMNAQGGPVMEDEEEMDRDWLDWVYTAARLGVFLSIVYFYSSLSRFALVMSSLLLMYLHTAGWFPFRQRPLVRGPNNQVPEVIQNQDRNPVPPVEVPAGEEGAEAEVGPDEPHPLTAVPVPQHRVSIVWSAWIFFKAFFASLIPEAPGVAN